MTSAPASPLSMIELAGPLHLLGVVLVVSAIGKLVDPWPSTGAMRDAGLPVPFRGRPYGGVLLGLVEGTIGLVALAVPEWWAATALAGFYGALALFVARLRSRDGDAGCGCFGASSTPPGPLHLVLNVGGAAVGAVAAVVGVPDVVEVFDEGLGVAVPYVALLAIGAGLVLVAPTLFAELAQARAGDRPRAFAPTSRPSSRSTTA